MFEARWARSIGGGKGIRTERSNLGHTTNTHRLDGQTRGRRLDEGEYPPCLSLVVLLAD